MKGNKKILIAIVMMLFTVVFTSYAIYRNSVTGNGTIKAANWVVQVNGTAINSATLDFDYDDIVWTSNPGKNNTIAPGAVGTITIPVDATGSEVDVLLKAEVDSSAVLPNGFTAVVTSGTGGEQPIAYNASSMRADVVVTVTWTGDTDDTTEKDRTDMAAAGSTLTIPVTLTARQKLAGE